MRAREITSRNRVDRPSLLPSRRGTNSEECHQPRIQRFPVAPPLKKANRAKRELSEASHLRQYVERTLRLVDACIAPAAQMRRAWSRHLYSKLSRKLSAAFRSGYSSERTEVSVGGQKAT